MNARLLGFCLGASLAPALLFGGEETAFAEKAAELTQGKAGRLDKLVAVHSFTRDQIRQVQTSYA
jgi:hypothetical protein